MIWLIRHGESLANTGAATQSHSDIPLTEIGHQQAQQVALILPKQPTLVVTSPFLRTQQTAEPTLRRFPQTPQVCWPIQEFTYLAPATCIGTTAIQRKERVNAYWERNDPDYVDGEGAESFNTLIGRVRDMLKCLQNTQGFVTVFTHGQIMLTTHLLQTYPNASPETIMNLFCAAKPIRNTEIMPLCV